MDIDSEIEKGEESQLKPMKLNIFVDDKLLIPINVFPMLFVE